MIKKLNIRISTDGIFFFLNFFRELRDILFSNIVSFFIKKQIKIAFPCKIKGSKYIEFSDHFSSGSGLWLEAIDDYFGQSLNPQIKLGKGINISENVHIAAINFISIGQNVLIGSNVLITDHQHGDTSLSQMVIIPKFRQLISRGGVKIGDSVWLGNGVIILDNVTIGNNCIIGANSVVLRDIPANSIAVGNPAKIIKTLQITKE